MANCITCGQDLEALLIFESKVGELEARLAASEVRLMTREEVEDELRSKGVDPVRVENGLISFLGKKCSEHGDRVRELESELSSIRGRLDYEERRADQAEASLKTVGELIASVRQNDARRLAQLQSAMQKIVANTLPSTDVGQIARSAIGAG